MSIQIGGKSFHGATEEGLLVQEGEVTLPPGATLDVFYPIPYASTPNLEQACHVSDCIVTDQHPDHFRATNQSASARTLSWKARGIRGLPPPPPAPVAVPPAS